MKKILPYLAVFPPLLLCGAILGGFVAARLLEQPADGWTQISQALGGMMLGGLGGLVAAVILIMTLPPRRLWWVAGCATLAVVIFIVVARATLPEDDVSDAPAERTPKPSRSTEAAPSAVTPEKSQ